MLKNAESAFALMDTACEAVKRHCWDEAEEMLRRVQSMVHQLRVDGLPSPLESSCASHTGWIERNTLVPNAELKAAGASLVLAMAAAENGDWAAR